MSYPIGNHEENEKLKREVAQLKIHYESEHRRADDRAEENMQLRAMVNALREAALTFVNDSYKPSHKYDAMRFDYLKEVADKTLAQSLHDRDMAIAEAVREACKTKALSMYLDENNAVGLEVVYSGCIEDALDSTDLASIVKGVK